MESPASRDNTPESYEKTENDDINQHNVCAPIKTLSELWKVLEMPPKWINYIIHLNTRSNFVIKNSISDCHVESHKFIPGMRLDERFVPKTLVCHDMKNGYLEDKYIGPVNVGNGYTFYHWSQIDIFVYFSHHLITIPPLSWINVAHKNGVPVLGTFITEWDVGSKVCNDILQNTESITRFADALINICILFKLDGWLINIENKIEHPEKLIEFLSYLTIQLHKNKAGTHVIWYDSVTNNGSLQWQNELNDLNRQYFDVCDGIYLNYCWKKNNLENSVKAAKHRILDVYAGVDIFGRGSFGGGKLNTHLAAEIVRKYGLSLALFAPGWTHETLEVEPRDTFLERFYEKDNKFWKSLWPYLYTHLLTSVFQTFFHTGVDKEWYALGKQDIHPSKILVHEGNLIEFSEISTLESACYCLQLQTHNDATYCQVTSEQLNREKIFVHHLFSCEIQIDGSYSLFTYTRDIYNINYQIILLIQDKDGHIKKVICHSNESHIEKSNPSIIEVNPLKNHDSLNIVGPSATSNDWKLRCFNLYGDHIKILEIGISILNSQSVSICGFGIRVNN